MKKILYITLLWASALFVASCDTNKNVDDNDINFSSRSGGTVVKSWTADQKIGVFMYDLTSGNVIDNSSNKTFIASSSGDNVTFTPADDNQKLHFPGKGQKVSFAAYYPYTTGVAEELSIDITSQTDVLYAKSDNNGSGYENTAVSFDFKHAMSCLVMNVTLGKGLETHSIGAVSVQGLDTKGKLNISTGAISQREAVKSLTPSQDGSTYTIYVLPQGPKENSKVVFTIAGVDYIWDISAISFEGGKKYLYDISVDKYGVVDCSVKVGDWLVGKTITGEGGKPRPSNAIKYEVGDYYPNPDADVLVPAEKSAILGVVISIEPESNGTRGKILFKSGGSDLWCYNNFMSIETGATSYTDGRANMDAIKLLESWSARYRAARWCWAFTGTKADDAYLPSAQELLDLVSAVKEFGVEEFDNKLSAAGGTKLINNADQANNRVNAWWTSTSGTDTDITNAYVVHFYSDAPYLLEKKTTGMGIRAIWNFDSEDDVVD